MQIFKWLSHYCIHFGVAETFCYIIIDIYLLSNVRKIQIENVLLLQISFENSTHMQHACR